MKFFIDNNLSPQLADGMKGFGERVIHLQERFPPDSKDPDWLKYIGQKKYFLVTRDDRIRWHPAELNALITFKVGAFFLGGKNRTRCQLIQQMVRNWPKIKELALKTPIPFAFRIPPSGSKVTKLNLPN